MCTYIHMHIHSSWRSTVVFKPSAAAPPHISQFGRRLKEGKLYNILHVYTHHSRRLRPNTNTDTDTDTDTNTKTGTDTDT